MGVSIDIYRQSIGMFNQSVMKVRSVSEKSRHVRNIVQTYPNTVSSPRQRKTNKDDFSRCIFMYLFVFCVVITVNSAENDCQEWFNLSSYKRNSSNLSKFQTNNFLQDNDEYRKAIGISWSYCIKSNKLGV